MIGPIAILFYDKSKSNSIEFGNLFYGYTIQNLLRIPKHPNRAELRGWAFSVSVELSR